MNCKKLIAALAALAVSAIPVTGFAADVTTTTTYNTESGKVEVVTAVLGATSDSEVTYIVKSNNEIVYIDQDTALDGMVEFSYKISKEKLAEDYSTTVKFGSSSETDEFSGNGSETLGIMSLQQAESDSHYSITYPDGKTAWGYGETVVATLVADDGYEITAIYIDGVMQDVMSNTVEISYGQKITADVQAVVVDPGLGYILIDTEDETGENAGLKSRVAILKPQGDVESIGVVYDGNYYASSTTEMSAVKIIFPAYEDDFNLVGVYKVADNSEIIEGVNETSVVSEQ